MAIVQLNLESLFEKLKTKFTWSIKQQQGHAQNVSPEYFRQQILYKPSMHRKGQSRNVIGVVRQQSNLWSS